MATAVEVRGAAGPAIGAECSSTVFPNATAAVSNRIAGNCIHPSCSRCFIACVKARTTTTEAAAEEEEDDEDEDSLLAATCA